MRASMAWVSVLLWKEGAQPNYPKLTFFDYVSMVICLRVVGGCVAVEIGDGFI